MPATPPFVSLPLVPSGTVAIAMQSTAYVRENPADPSQSLIATYSQDPSEPYLIGLGVDAVTALLAAASGGGGGGGLSPVAVAQVDAIGNVVAGAGGLVPLPYTPGSADYAFQLSPYVAAFYAVVATAGEVAADAEAVIAANQSAPPFFTAKIRDKNTGMPLEVAFSIVLYRL